MEKKLLVSLTIVDLVYADAALKRKPMTIQEVRSFQAFSILV